MKKLISLLLAVIMVVSVFAMPTLAIEKDVAEVGAPTQAEAIAWLNAQVGKSLDYDGAYGAQCVDLIKYYYNFFGYASYAKGNGCDYATNTLPPNWSRIKGATPQTGDIMVWTGGPGDYGHVAIYGGGNNYYHQNWNGNYVEILTKSYTGGITYKSGGYAPYWGVIRPQFGTQPSEKPDKPYLTSNKSVYPYGEDVTLTWEKTAYANNYWLDFYKNGVKIDGRTVTSPLVLTDLEPGNYTAFITANNLFGHTTSNACIFEVFNSAPGKPYLTSNKSVYPYGEDVTLSWEKTTYANNYWLDFYKDGVRIDGRTVTSPLVLTDLEPGNYTAFITANNLFGHTTSNACIFEVKDNDFISPEVIVGDADGDGKISVVDATVIQRHLAEIKIFTEEQIVRADTYKDGKITILDATQIQRFLAEIITEF